MVMLETRMEGFQRVHACHWYEVRSESRDAILAFAMMYGY